MSDEEPSTPSRRTKVLGWTVISLVGGGAAVISLMLCGLLLLVLDVFVLAKGPATTEYLTIVRHTGGWAVPAAGEEGATYEDPEAR